MPKQNRHTPWNQLFFDETGAHMAAVASGVNDPAESSNQAVNATPNYQNERYMQSDDRRAVAAYKDQINDVLYVHSTDHPGMALTTDLLNDKNFHSWSRSIRRGLAAKNKLDFIDGSMIEPTVNSIDHKQWLRVDFLVFSWIVNSISKELGRGFQHLETSKDLWSELNRRFGRTNGLRLYKLRRELATYSQGNQSVLVYYNNLQSLWDEIHLLVPSPTCTCGAAEHSKKIEEGDHLMQFLMGLSDDYETVRSQILILDPLPSVSQAYSMILQVEDQKDVTSRFPTESEHNALYSNQKPYGNRFDNFRKRLSKEEKSRLKCHHCGGNGHDKSECFELIGVPEWYKKFRNDKLKNRANCIDEEDVHSLKSENPTALTEPMTDMNRLIQAEVAKYIGTILKKNSHDESSSNAANLVELDHKGNDQASYMGHYAFGIRNDIHRNEWIIDSGASIHMCCNIELMHNLNKLDVAQRIFLPDGSSIEAQVTGEVRLTAEILLRRVLFAPSFIHNLISVSELTKDVHGKVLFLPNHCLIQSHDHDKYKGVGKLKGRLYVIQQDEIKDVVAYSSLMHNTLALKDWHEVLGHPSIGSMKHFSHIKRKFSDAEFSDLKACDICFQSKQQRLPFPPLKKRSSAPFELVHADVWGPYNEENITHTAYILTLVEDYSRSTWTYLLHSKGQVFRILHSFFAMVQTHFNTKVKSLRTDNGSEFLGQQTQNLLHDAGILHQKSCVYSPQQNGIVERKHRHLLQVARALMFQSKLPTHVKCHVMDPTQL